MTNGISGSSRVTGWTAASSYRVGSSTWRGRAGAVKPGKSLWSHQGDLMTVISASLCASALTSQKALNPFSSIRPPTGLPPTPTPCRPHMLSDHVRGAGLR